MSPTRNPLRYRRSSGSAPGKGHYPATGLGWEPDEECRAVRVSSLDESGPFSMSPGHLCVCFSCRGPRRARVGDLGWSLPRGRVPAVGWFAARGGCRCGLCRCRWVWLTEHPGETHPSELDRQTSLGPGNRKIHHTRQRDRFGCRRTTGHRAWPNATWPNMPEKARANDSHPFWVTADQRQSDGS